MSGICGFVGGSDEGAAQKLDAMARQFAWTGPASVARQSGHGFAFAAAGAAGSVAVASAGPVRAIVQGHPHWRDDVGAGAGIESFCQRLATQWRERGPQVLALVAGDFAVAVYDERTASLALAVDRIGVRNLVYQQSGDVLVFGATSDVVNAHPRADATVSPQALYDYVYFHMIPGPATIYRDQLRVPAGCCVRYESGRARVEPYWELRFVEDERTSVAARTPAFRDALRAGVAAYAGDGAVGTFLSGGTDSTTVTGTLGEVTGRPPRTYSIGFEAAGYDEMEYARIAARRFATVHHEYYVTPADVVSAIPLIAAAYDQPFGNASAVPTYHCARFAHGDGIARMLGGDGGDELFGGNSRYAKQYQLSLFSRMPSVARAALEAALMPGTGSGGAALIRKARSYVEQARLPMPARYETYNLLERLGPGNVFNPEFLATVDRTGPLVQLTRRYDAAHAQSLVNRMLALDIKFTLADNDLPKVTRTCDIAGVDVAFPLLHESVLDFSTSLPPDLKLRGTRLRYFFKEALRGFLPDEIITKEKHGFGLPAGPWLRDYPPLHALAADSIASLRGRKIFRDDLLDGLLGPLMREHPGYYGTLTWVLMMLEMWFRKPVGR